MFCTQCGKKVSRDMLFCPYCGHPIVPLEEDESDASASELENLKGMYGRPEKEPPEEEKPIAALPSQVGSEPEENVVFAPKAEKTPPDSGFVPLEEMYSRPQENAPKVESLFAKWEAEDAQETSAKSTPVRLTGHTPDLNRRPSTRKASDRPRKPSTYVPRKEPSNPDDLFLDDEFEDAVRKRPRRSGSDYEDQPKGDFLYRHIRGIVSLALMLMLVVIIAMWAFSNSGQRVLARFGASNKPGIYAELGREAYDQSAFSAAGRWYEQALARDPDNYNYAYSAGVCYYEAQNAGKAETFFRQAIALRPDDANAYLYLRALYANANALPQDVAALLQQGYERTGNEQLRVS